MNDNGKQKLPQNPAVRGEELMRHLVKRQGHIRVEFGDGIAPYETDIDFEVSAGAAERDMAGHLVGRFMAQGMITRSFVSSAVGGDLDTGVEVLNPLAAKRFVVTFNVIARANGGLIV